MFNNFLGGLSSGGGSQWGGGGDALPAVNGLTFDDVEATADFENQLGPPPAGFITQPEGDGPNAGYTPPAPPGVGGGMNPPPPPPQQAVMGGGQQTPGDAAYSSIDSILQKLGGIHSGQARSATKGNPGRPGKSDGFPRIRGQCTRIPGIFGHAGESNTCLHDSHPRRILLPHVRHQHLPG